MMRRRQAMGMATLGLADGPGGRRAAAADPAAALPLTLATATPGGGFPAYGAAFIAAVAEVEPGLVITSRNTAGSTENVRLLAAGTVDLGLVQGEAAHAALAGTAGITVLTAMYAAPSLFAQRGDGTAQGFGALRGKRIAWGARGSGFIILARQAIGALGLDLERDFASSFLDRAGDGPAMVLDGQVDALWGGGVGWPGFMAIADSPAGAHFVAPTPAERSRILGGAPMLRAMDLPANSYAGQPAAIATIGTWSMVLARPGLPDAIGYQLAAAIDRAAPTLTRLLPAAAETTARNTLAAAPGAASIHPGVRRFLREAGLE